jgi:hypothetical protein
VARRVGEANRIMARLRRHDIFVKEVEFSNEEKRDDLLAQLPDRLLCKDISLLWRSYDANASQADDLRADLRYRGRRIDVVKRFEAVPGIGPIRAATFYVYVDTPWRFRSKSALYRYAGISLERRHSGTGPTQWRVGEASQQTFEERTHWSGQVGDRPTREPLCRPIPERNRARTDRSQRTSHGGSPSGVGVVGHVEKRHRVPARVAHRRLLVRCEMMIEQST